MNKLYKLIQNSGHMIFVQLLNYAAPLLIFPYLGRVFSQNTFSDFIFVLAIIQLQYLISEFGVNIFATKKLIDINDFKSDETSLINGSIVQLKLMIVVLSTFASTLYLSLHFDSYLYLILPIFGTVIFYAFQPQWLFMASEDMSKISLSSSIGKFSYLMLVMVLVKSDDDFLLVFYLLMISNLVSLLLSTKFYLAICNKLPSYSCEKFIWACKTSVSFLFSRIATIIPISSPVVILGAFFSPSMIVSYVAVDQLYKAARGVSGAVVQALYPFTTKNKNLKLFSAIVISVSVLISIVCVVFSYFSSDVLAILFNLSGEDSVTIYNVFLFSVLVSFFSQVLGYPLFSLVDKITVANRTSYYAFCYYIISVGVLYVFNMISPLNMAFVVLSYELIFTLLRLVFFYSSRNERGC